MSKIYFDIAGDVIVRYTPHPEIGEDIYETEPIMDKDTFVKCYEMWIEEAEKIGHRIYNDIFDHYQCEKCKNIVMDYDNYCPSCGLKFESEEQA